MKNPTLLILFFLIAFATAGEWTIKYESHTPKKKERSEEHYKSYDRTPHHISYHDFDLVYSNKTKRRGKEKGYTFYLNVDHHNEVYGLVRKYHRNGDISTSRIRHGYLNPYTGELSFETKGMRFAYYGQVKRNRLDGENDLNARNLNLRLMRGNPNAFVYAHHKKHHRHSIKERSSQNYGHFSQPQKKEVPKKTKKQKESHRIDEVYSLHEF